MSLLIDRNFGSFLISSDKSKIDAGVVHRFLDKESYWAQGVPLDTVKRAIEYSICLGVYQNNDTLVSFGRMITDRATFAYLADIFVLKEYRGQGISKALMNAFCDLGDQFGLRRFLLTTQDAHGLYRQSGFVPFPYPERMMSRPGVVYKNT